MNSKQKGKRGELEFSHWLATRGHPARRGQQFKGGDDSPDVVCDTLDNFHFEVKRTEKLSLYEAVEQAERDSGHKYPVVAHRRNRGDWLAVMKATDWLIMAEKVKKYEELN
jgi:Holliday junction resolvase